MEEWVRKHWFWSEFVLFFRTNSRNRNYHLDLYLSQIPCLSRNSCRGSKVSINHRDHSKKTKRREISETVVREECMNNRGVFEWRCEGGKVSYQLGEYWWASERTLHVCACFRRTSQAKAQPCFGSEGKDGGGGGFGGSKREVLSSRLIPGEDGPGAKNREMRSERLELFTETPDKTDFSFCFLF